MKKTIVFIHGMFQNGKSWEKWVSYFTEKGYNCVAPSWPLHEGEPSALRANPPAELGDLMLEDVITAMEAVVKQHDKPIVIGHSVGGLITQLMVNRGLAELGIPVNSVAPNGMLAFDWSFFKNSVTIMNPFKGDEIMPMDEKTFKGAFANTLSDEQLPIEYEKTATHDSRNVLRGCMGEHGKVDVDMPHVPMFFIAGEEDQIIPSELVEKNSKAYTDEVSIAEYKNYPGRSHYICNEPGYEEVLADVASFIERYDAQSFTK